MAIYNNRAYYGEKMSTIGYILLSTHANIYGAKKQQLEGLLYPNYKKVNEDKKEESY